MRTCELIKSEIASFNIRLEREKYLTQLKKLALDKTRNEWFWTTLIFKYKRNPWKLINSFRYTVEDSISKLIERYNCFDKKFLEIKNSSLFFILIIL